MESHNPYSFGRMMYQEEAIEAAREALAGLIGSFAVSKRKDGRPVLYESTVTGQRLQQARRALKDLGEL
jgi:hypothetical protein